MKRFFNLNLTLNQHKKLFSTGNFDFDVLIVGAGHAGTEAAYSACNLNAKTAIITQRLDTIGAMSCNPSFGGVGKGHLLREIDALDGLCAKICDQAGIHYKVLNKRKGPAVWGLRAQIDRDLYKKYLQKELFNRPIHFEENSVEDLLIEQKDDKLYCNGVILKDGKKLKSKTTIITTGTFLNGLILIGKESFSAGRMGDKASIGLSETIKKLNFKMGRLKTGTPPRIFKDTIDYDELEVINADSNPIPFSYLNDKVRIKPDDQIPTYITYTDSKIEELVKSNINSSSYIRQEAKGVRYCPSLGLETKLVNNLYLAGQINGTTGYEEAAAQGLIAGINAAGKTKGKSNFLINRTEAFIGVIIDDITNNGVLEPYRMMTARSEYRMSIRPDNADKRLTEKGFKYGCVNIDRYNKYLKTMEQMEFIKDELTKLKYKNSVWIDLLKSVGIEYDPLYLNSSRDGLKLIEKYSFIKTEDLIKLIPNSDQLNISLFNRIDIESKYKFYEEKQNLMIKEFRKEEELELDKDLDYSQPSLCLNKESIELLTKYKPLNIASAGKLSGIPKETIFRLILFARKQQDKIDK